MSNNVATEKTKLRRIIRDAKKELKNQFTLMITATKVNLQMIPSPQFIVFYEKNVCLGGGIIDTLNLKNPIFSQTSEWGHMGNNFPWG